MGAAIASAGLFAIVTLISMFIVSYIPSPVELLLYVVTTQFTETVIEELFS